MPIQETKFICINNCKLYTKTIKSSVEASNSTTLVFLHEGLGSVAHWRDFPEQLCRQTGYNGFLYDRAGYGKSDPLKKPRSFQYLYEEAISTLRQVLEQCNIQQPILIGHSDGGTIALLHAGHYPQSIKGVITEAAHVFVEEITLQGIKKSLDVFKKDQDLMGKFMKYQNKHAEMILSDWKNIWLSPEYKNWNIESYLPGIMCPVLVIQGEDDEYGTVAQVEAIASQVSGPSQILLIPECGHRPHHQARELVLSEMRLFIAGILD